MPKGQVGFSKDDPNINRAGRPIGSVSVKRRRWYNLQEFSEWAEELLEDMPKKEKIAYIKHWQSLLMSKLSKTPNTPEQSLENVVGTKPSPEKELEQAENASNSQP